MTQEIFLKIFWAIEDFDSPRTSFTTWLYRVAPNHLPDYYRCSQKGRVTVSNEEDFLRLEQDPGRERPPSDQPELSEGQALEQLSPGLREGVVLRDLHGLEYTHVSRALGIPSGTAKSRVHRGHLGLGRVLNVQRGEMLQGVAVLPTEDPARPCCSNSTGTGQNRRARGVQQ